MSASTGQRKAAPSSRATLVLVVATVVVSNADTAMLNLLAPAIGRDLDATLESVRAAVSMKSLAFAAGMIGCGHLGDSLGRRRAYLAGLTLFGLGAVVSASAGSMAMVAAGEAGLRAFGICLLIPATTSVIAATFEGDARTKAFGVWGATVGITIALAPTVGGLAIALTSWRWCVLATGMMAPLLALGAWRCLPPDGPMRSVDWRGGVAIGGLITALVVVLSWPARWGWARSTSEVTGWARLLVPPGRWSPVPLALVLIAIGAWFVHRVEMKRSAADRTTALPVGAFRHRSFRYGVLAGIVGPMGQWSLWFVVPLYLQVGLGRSVLVAGLAQLPAGLMTMFASTMSARASARMGSANVLRAGLVIEAVGLIGVGLSIVGGWGILGLLPGLLVYGTGFGCFSAQVANVALHGVPPRLLGASGAMIGASRQIGASFALAVIGALLVHGATNAAMDDLRAQAPPGQEVAEVTLGTVDASAPARRALADGVSDHAPKALWLGAAMVLAGALVPAPTSVRGAAVDEGSGPPRAGDPRVLEL